MSKAASADMLRNRFRNKWRSVKRKSVIDADDSLLAMLSMLLQSQDAPLLVKLLCHSSHLLLSRDNRVGAGLISDLAPVFE